MASQAVIIEARRGPIIRSARVFMVDAGSMARGNPLDTPWDYDEGLAEFCNCHCLQFKFSRLWFREGGALEAGRTVRDTHGFGDNPSPSPGNWAEG